MKLVASGVPAARQGLGEDRAGDKAWPRRERATTPVERTSLVPRGAVLPWEPQRREEGGRGTPGSSRTLPQSAMQARAPRAPLHVGWERSWSAPRWRMTVAPPSAAVSLWARGTVGLGLGLGASRQALSTPFPSRASAVHLQWHILWGKGSVSRQSGKGRGWAPDSARPPRTPCPSCHDSGWVEAPGPSEAAAVESHWELSFRLSQQEFQGRTAPPTGLGSRLPQSALIQGHVSDPV